MTIHHVVDPPSPLQAVLKVERPTVQQNLNFITINIALGGGGGGRGGTIVLSYGQSHNFCEGLSEI